MFDFAVSSFGSFLSETSGFVFAIAFALFVILPLVVWYSIIATIRGVGTRVSSAVNNLEKTIAQNGSSPGASEAKRRAQEEDMIRRVKDEVSKTLERSVHYEVNSLLRDSKHSTDKG